MSVSPLLNKLQVLYECKQQINNADMCYLGNNLDGDVAEDLAATAIIRNGWKKFRELFPFLTSRIPPLEMKGRVYASCVRSRITYRSETRSLLAANELKFERSELQMTGWMCGVSMKDRRTSEDFDKFVWS